MAGLRHSNLEKRCQVGSAYHLEMMNNEFSYPGMITGLSRRNTAGGKASAALDPAAASAPLLAFHLFEMPAFHSLQCSQSFLCIPNLQNKQPNCYSKPLCHLELTRWEADSMKKALHLTMQQPPPLPVGVPQGP